MGALGRDGKEERVRLWGNRRDASLGMSIAYLHEGHLRSGPSNSLRFLLFLIFSVSEHLLVAHEVAWLLFLTCGSFSVIHSLFFFFF